MPTRETMRKWENESEFLTLHQSVEVEVDVVCCKRWELITQWDKHSSLIADNLRPTPWDDDEWPAGGPHHGTTTISQEKEEEEEEEGARA